MGDGWGQRHAGQAGEGEGEVQGMAGQRGAGCLLAGSLSCFVVLHTECVVRGVAWLPGGDMIL